MEFLANDSPVKARLNYADLACNAALLTIAVLPRLADVLKRYLWLRDNQHTSSTVGKKLRLGQGLRDETRGRQPRAASRFRGSSITMVFASMPFRIP